MCIRTWNLEPLSHIESLENASERNEPSMPRQTTVLLSPYMQKNFLTLCISLLLCSATFAKELSHENAMTRLPENLLAFFAKAQVPDTKGAVGRNREQYIHARFQYRIHHLADYAVRKQNAEAARYFIQAVEYGFQHQLDDGGFELKIPDDMKGKSATRGDLASGAAFFLASAGSGALSLRQSSWFQTSDETAPLRKRLDKFGEPMKRGAKFLSKEQETIAQYDATAPNRLMIDALAFQSLGVLFSDSDLIENADRFLARALEQQQEDGYFIEGGGFDSSYNGVSVAVGYRLALFRPNDAALRDALEKAIRWQETRVLDTGEIITEGNSRVFDGGESFLGKEKTVDVSHTVEAFALAYAFTRESHYLARAQMIAIFYTEAKITRVPVEFSGGHNTVTVDRGRPVILIAGALGVAPEVFREAFSHVNPAMGGGEPEPTQVRKNKQALISRLAPYGITNERLDEVSNYYRYQPQRGEMWPTRSAVAYALIKNGVITGFEITDGGSGYSSPPTIRIPGFTNIAATATLAFGSTFENNGAVAEISLK